MKVYLLIVEDRHFDVEVWLHRTRAQAFTALQSYLGGLPTYVTDYRAKWDMTVTEEMARDGWLAYVRYSDEGGSARIVERELIE